MSLKAVDAIKVTKEPPPESSQKIWARRLVIATFWSVVLFLGLPLWWRTTTVYRADLPLQLMTDWADGKICSPTVLFLVELDAPNLAREHGEPLLNAAREAYNKVSDQASMHNVEFTSSYDTVQTSLHNEGGRYKHKALTIRLSASKGKFWSSKDNAKPTASVEAHGTVLDISYGKAMESESNFVPSLGTFIAETLQAMIAEEDAILAYLRSPSISAAATKHLSEDVAESVARRPTRAFKYAATYHLTFSLFTPEASPYSWAIEKGLRETFNPLLAALRPISNFTLETQVQPYAALSPSLQPIFDEKLKAWTIPREELGGFVNAAEWPLSPSIGSGPTIHFVLYVASASQSPLIIEGSSSNSWLVPQWGGIAIHNPKLKPGAANPASLSASDLRPALLTFSNHLISLLGLPSTPSESFPLRLASLTRIRATSLFLSASSTLGSLARLVSQLPSISIPDSVADNVSATLEHLNFACRDLKMGSFDGAIKNAREADAQAEKAFFEKSMVGQVYFPDEHKVAVYLPLLGPVAVPLLVSAIREIKPLLQRSRGR